MINKTVFEMHDNKTQHHYGLKIPELFSICALFRLNTNTA